MLEDVLVELLLAPVSEDCVVVPVGELVLAIASAPSEVDMPDLALSSGGGV